VAVRVTFRLEERGAAMPDPVIAPPEEEQAPPAEEELVEEELLVEDVSIDGMCGVY
jgi:mycofactocin precursor